MSHILYVTEENGVIFLRNEHLEIGFSKKYKGTIVHVKDLRTGFQFIRSHVEKGIFFKICLRCGKENRWIENLSAGKFNRVISREKNRIKILFSYTEFSGVPGLEVIVRIVLSVRSNLMRFSMSLRNAPFFIVKIVFPIISGIVKPGKPAKGECLATPIHGEGYLFENPYPFRNSKFFCSGKDPLTQRVGIGNVSGIYPGSLSMQMYAWYNKRAGLYLACHDGKMNPKIFAFGSYPPFTNPVFRIEHLFPETRKTINIPYDCIIGIFHGDWYDAADIYSKWAKKQWWCKKKLIERDIPEWMKKGIGGVFPDVELSYT